MTAFKSAATVQVLIAGHYDAGMVGKIKVVARSAPEPVRQSQ
jgi:uncharacterized cupredoxin-like copper-binding protein